MILGFLFFLLFQHTISGVSVERPKCEPLVPNVNVEVTCSSGSVVSEEMNMNSTDCSVSQCAGTLATYKCKEYFTSFEINADKIQPENVLRCGRKGVWTGLPRFLAYKCKEDCGNVQGPNKPLLINGVSTSRTSHPWHAMLFVSNSLNEWLYICGASIIRTQVLLTAAHCIVTNPDKYRVILGGVSTNFSKNQPDTGASVHSVRHMGWGTVKPNYCSDLFLLNVQRFYTSENYDPKKGYQADIALILLSEGIKYNEFRSPVCLPDDYSADIGVIRNGVSGQIAGFGITENGTVPDFLRLIMLNVKSSSECYHSLHRVLSESQFCAGSKPGEAFQTVCNGDSGNGLTFLSTAHKKFYVHGIVSSSDSDARKGVCQNFAVFTRIYYFVFWIRDVLEEISGQVGRELLSNIPYPYVLHGTEVRLKIYGGLPSEWENRVTKLELRNVYAQVSELLTSLEYAKTLSSIDIRQLVLDKPFFESKLVLPLLNSFHLDILRPDFKLNTLRMFPEHLTESYLKSLLFYYRDYTNREWTLSNLLTMKTDVDLTLHIFRVLHINYSRGEFYLNQVSFADKFLGNFTSTAFNLKRLALHRSKVNFNSISSTASRTLTTLVLSDVELLEEIDVSSVIRRFENIKNLVLHAVTLPKQSVRLILLSDLTSLDNLSLTGSVHVTLSTSPIISAYEHRIVFPDEDLVELINRREKHKILNLATLSNLKTLCCLECSLDPEIWKKFNIVFPNLTSLVLKTEAIVDLTSILEIKTLKTVHIESSKNFSGFGGIEKFISKESNHFVALRLTRKPNQAWKWSEGTEESVSRVHYSCKGGSYFWTSEEDYRSKIRLKTFERDGYTSGHYVFNGKDFNQDPGRISEFAGIPEEIQSKLQSIEFQNVAVTPRVLSESVEHCSNLKSLTLLNSRVIGNGLRYTFRTENLTFILDSARVGNLTFEYIYEEVNGKLIAGIVPFQNFGRFNMSNSSNALSRVFRNVSSVRLEQNRATTYIFDSTMAELRASYRTVRETFISRLPDSHKLKPMLKNLIDIKMAYRDILPPEWEFPGLQIIDQNVVKSFYQDSTTQLFGDLGIIKYLLKRYGKYLNLATLSFTAVKNHSSVIPPLQAISLSLIRDKYSLSIQE